MKGDVFGIGFKRWKLMPEPREDGKIYFVATCDCGENKYIEKSQMTWTKSPLCGKCIKKRARFNQNKTYKKIAEKHRSLYFKQDELASMIKLYSKDE
jgi:PHP family Zn ribbon phosphoesterase